MALLYRGTAYTRVFKMIDGVDHFSKKTGLSLNARVSKAGQAFVTAGGTTAEVGNGWYSLSLNTTDTNTMGDLAYYIFAVGTTPTSFADDTDFVDQVVNFNYADGTRMGLLALPNASSATSGGLPTVGTGASQIDVDSAGRVNVGKWLGGVIPSQNIAGIPNVNVTYHAGGTAPLPNITGVPIVDMKYANGTTFNPLIAGRFDVNAQVVGDKTGYSLTQAFPTNFSTLSIDSSGRTDVGKWIGGAIPSQNIAGIPNVNISYYAGGTSPIPNVVGVPIIDMKYANGTTLLTPINGRINANAQVVGDKTAYALSSSQTFDVTGNITGNLSGSVGSVTGAVGSVIGAVGSVTGAVGSVTGAVGSVAAGGIAAASFAANAVDANALAADAVTEIWAKACTEPTSVVAASPTVIAALSWLLTLSRNTITQTATAQIIKADDTSTTIATSTVSDDGTTFSRGEFA